MTSKNAIGTQIIMLGKCIIACAYTVTITPFPPRLQEEYQRADPTHSEAAALFEEELQSMATQLDQEFGKDSGSEWVDWL